MVFPQASQQLRCVLSRGTERLTPSEGFPRCQTSLIGFDTRNRSLIDAEFSRQSPLGYRRIVPHLREGARKRAVEVAFRCERWGHAVTLLRVSPWPRQYACAYVESA